MATDRDRLLRFHVKSQGTKPQRCPFFAGIPCWSCACRPAAAASGSRTGSARHMIRRSTTVTPIESLSSRFSARASWLRRSPPPPPTRCRWQRPAVAAESGVTLARWGRGPGPLGIFGAIVAGTLVAAAITEHRARHEDMEHCAADFRSFDSRTGTYINRYGRGARLPVSALNGFVTRRTIKASVAQPAPFRISRRPRRIVAASIRAAILSCASVR